MGGPGAPRARLPNKASLTMRHELERRGIDIVEMQLEVYRKAIAAFDNERGCSDGGEQGPKDTGAGYLSVANQAIATLARYSYPTMTAIKIEEADREVNEKVIDAVKVREAILNDPFAASVAKKAVSTADTGLPVLVGGKKEG